MSSSLSLADRVKDLKDLGSMLRILTAIYRKVVLNLDRPPAKERLLWKTLFELSDQSMQSNRYHQMLWVDLIRIVTKIQNFDPWICFWIMVRQESLLFNSTRGVSSSIWETFPTNNNALIVWCESDLGRANSRDTKSSKCLQENGAKEKVALQPNHYKPEYSTLSSGGNLRLSIGISSALKRIASSLDAPAMQNIQNNVNDAESGIIMESICDLVLACISEKASSSEELVERLQHCAAFLKMKVLPDILIVTLFSQLMRTCCNSSKVSSAVSAFIVPKVLHLRNAAPRSILKTISDLAARYPVAIVQGLLLPLLLNCKIVLSRAHVEVATRVLLRSGLGKDYVVLFMSQVTDPNCQALSKLLTDPAINILQSVINLKVRMPNLVISRIIQGMESAVNDCKVKKSVKFSTVLFGIVSKYAKQCKQQSPCLLRVALKCETFMAKSAIRAIKKL